MTCRIVLLRMPCLPANLKCHSNTHQTPICPPRNRHGPQHYAATSSSNAALAPAKCWFGSSGSWPGPGDGKPEHKTAAAVPATSKHGRTTQCRNASTKASTSNRYISQAALRGANAHARQSVPVRSSSRPHTPRGAPRGGRRTGGPTDCRYGGPPSLVSSRPQGFYKSAPRGHTSPSCPSTYTCKYSLHLPPLWHSVSGLRRRLLLPVLCCVPALIPR